MSKDVADILVPQLEFDRVMLDRHALALVARVIEVPRLLVVFPCLPWLCRARSESEYPGSLSACRSQPVASIVCDLVIFEFEDS